MIQEQEDTFEDLEHLNLTQIFQRDDLCLEEIFTIKDIHNKIKKQIKIFVDYCRKNESFTDRLISLGLKCPMHQSNNQQMKNVTYIAADILTTDNQALADLFILNHKKNSNSDDDGEIAEEIQTEDNVTEEQHVEVDKYKYLNKVLDYIKGENLEENCLNYITKTFQVLLRKRLNAFLQYFHQFPKVLTRLAEISHFPSVAHLLAKMITDDEDDMTAVALQTKSKILPLLIQKVHSELTLTRTLQVFQALEEILQSSRYSDAQQRSELQKLSDVLVSSSQILYHVNNVANAVHTLSEDSLSSIFNSISYLNIVVTRMNMDEQQDCSQQLQAFKPTLKYEVEGLYSGFSGLVVKIGLIEKYRSINEGVFKLLIVKYLELLSSMAKHSRFGSFYQFIAKEERLNGIKFLISNVAQRKYSGILLQIGSSLAEKIILEEERIAENHPESTNKISPSDLYTLIEEHQVELQELVHSLAHQSVHQRNKNEQGIYLRKLLVVFDNFFKNTEIHKHFPQIKTITKLFPTFTHSNCKQYADKAVITNHPGGNRAKTPQQFKFIQRNQTYLASLIVDELVESPKVQEQESRPKPVELIFKLDGKIKTMKDRVKQKQTKLPQQQIKQKQQVKGDPIQNGQIPKNDVPKERVQIKVDSPTRATNSPQPCLLFFIRHLAIY